MPMLAGENGVPSPLCSAPGWGTGKFNCKLVYIKCSYFPVLFCVFCKVIVSASGLVNYFKVALWFSAASPFLVLLMEGYLQNRVSKTEQGKQSTYPGRASHEHDAVFK